MRCTIQCTRVLGNIIAIDDNSSEERGLVKLLIENELLGAIQRVLLVGTKDMKKEVLWLLSNVSANSSEDSAEIVRKGLISNIMYMASDKNLDIRKEAVWVLSNICFNLSDPECLREMINSNIVHMFCDILSFSQDLGAILMLTLTGLKHLFEKD